MPKYLRYLSVTYSRIDMTDACRDVHFLVWMYEHHLKKCPSDGISKVNLQFHPPGASSAPPEALLNVVVMEFPLDADRLRGLPPDEKRLAYLDSLHAALVSVAGRFGFDVTALAAARQAVVDAGFRLVLEPLRPVRDPARALKARAVVEVGEFSEWTLVIERSGKALARCLLCRSDSVSCDTRHVFDHIEWVDDRTVLVRRRNLPDSWRCSIDGAVELVDPRAEGGDPHAQYQLGRRYYEGQWVMPDEARGLQLIRSAANQSFKHAVNFLVRRERKGQDGP